VIRSFRSKALKRFFEKGETKGLQPQFIEKIGAVLDALNIAAHVSELDVPGFGLHALKGDRAGFYAIVITRNWRITFRFTDAVSGDAASGQLNTGEMAVAQELEIENDVGEDETFEDETGAHEVDYEDYH
jgi:proteic killer suppression protein